MSQFTPNYVRAQTHIGRYEPMTLRRRLSLALGYWLLEYGVPRRRAPVEDMPLARPDPGPEPHSVALVGAARCLDMPPFGRPGWELWSLNDLDFLPAHAFTRWFQLHPPRYLVKHYPPGLRDLDDRWGERRGVRLIMDQHYPEYPDSEAYPKEAVEALTPRGRYHVSSFDWMLALAIYEGFKHIAIYGVALGQPPLFNGEPVSSRPCLEYWIGVAEGRGITVELFGDDGDMFKNVHLAYMKSDAQYGFEAEPAMDLGNGWKDFR